MRLSRIRACGEFFRGAPLSQLPWWKEMLHKSRKNTRKQTRLFQCLSYGVHAITRGVNHSLAQPILRFSFSLIVPYRVLLVIASWECTVAESDHVHIQLPAHYPDRFYNKNFIIYILLVNLSVLFLVVNPCVHVPARKLRDNIFGSKPF